MAYSADRAHTTGYTQIRQWWPGYVLAGLLLVLGTAGGILLKGQLGQFMLSSIQTLPFALLALLTYLGVEYILARVFAFLWLGLLLVGIGLTGLLFAFGMLAARANGLNPGAGLALPPGAGGMLG